MFKKKKKIIGNYSKKDLKDISTISLTLPISTKALNNFNHIKNNTTLILNQSNKDILDEEKYYQDIMAEKSRPFVRVEDYKEVLNRFKYWKEKWEQNTKFNIDTTKTHNKPQC